MTVATALALGVLIGLTIGALGGGGSILTVPVLVYVLSLPAKEATTASLVIVGITAATAAAGYARAGRTRWRTGLALAVTGIPASIGGTALNSHVQPDVLLVCFAALMLVAAAGMLLRRSTPPPERPEGRGTAVRTRTRRAHMTRVALVGLVVGFLTGFLGVGGGFVIVPGLVVALGMPMPLAVGTSLLVIALNSGVALLARAGGQSFPWHVIVPFTLAAVLGSLGGRRLADRLPAAALSRAFALLLVGVAVYVAIEAGSGLT